jgi:hypothetical protein
MTPVCQLLRVREYEYEQSSPPLHTNFVMWPAGKNN